MSNARAENIITPEARGSFVHLFEREKKQNGEPGLFSMLLLFPKQSQSWMQDLPWLWENITAVLNQQFPGGQGMPPVFTQYGVGKPWPVSDGDMPNSMGNVQEAHKRHWVLRCGSGNFDHTINLIDEQTGALGTLTAATCFSGCYFKVQGNCYWFNRDGSVGVNFGMNNVALARQGESLGGGGVDAATAFGITPTTASAAAAFQPGAPAPQQPAPGVPVAGATAPAGVPATPAAAPVPTAPGPVGAAPAIPSAPVNTAPGVPSFMQ